MSDELDKLSDIAYIMQNAYKENRTAHQAVEQVSKQSEEDEYILYAMWSAIDAYVDINNNQ